MNIIKATKENPRAHKRSMRSKCFSYAKDGMTVDQYVASCSRHGIRKATAQSCLHQLERLHRVKLAKR